MRKFECGNVDGEGAIKKSDWLGAVLDSRNCAADDGFLVRFGNVGASMAREEEFAWGHESAIGTPKVIHDWWNDAAMHVASYEKVELVKITGYFRIEQKYRRVKQSDFGFMFW